MEKCSLNFVKTSITDVYSLKATFVPSGDIDNAWFSNFSVGIEMKHWFEMDQKNFII